MSCDLCGAPSLAVRHGTHSECIEELRSRLEELTLVVQLLREDFNLHLAEGPWGGEDPS